MSGAIPPLGLSEALWRRVELAPHRLLMLDFDGTLAPFRPDRSQARPHASALASLRRIARESRTTLAVVSGRPVRELEALLERVPAILVGEHGWESRAADGARTSHPLPAGALERLDAAEHTGREHGWWAHLERKRTGIVLNTRGLPAPEAGSLHAQAGAAWAVLAAGDVLRLDRTHGGLELRARGRDKGTAAITLLAAEPAGTLAVAVGDDVTDEDAFRAVAGHGFGVRVGDDGRESAARARLASCAEVPEFLGEWLRRTRSPHATRP